MRITKNRVWTFAALLLVSFLLQVAYKQWAVVIYAYQGMFPFEHTFALTLAQLAMLVAVAAMLPTKVTLPSDFYLLFYPWFVLVPFANIFPGGGYVGVSGSVVLFSLLAIPCLVVLLTRRFSIRTPVFPVLSENALMLILFCFSAFFFGWALARGLKFSLVWDEMYLRRAIGRELIESRSVLAYGLSATTNGVVPLMALFGGYRRSIALGSASMFLAILGFAAIGSKSPAAMSALFFALGWVQRSTSFRSRIPFAFSIIVCSTVLGAYSLYLWSGNDLVLDIFVRRVFFATATNIGMYWDLLNSYSVVEILFGKDHGVQLTFFVGEAYYGNAASNINVSAFLLSLLQGGALWYVVSMVAAAIFLTAVDRRFQESGHVGYMLVGAAFGLLIAEQAWTTALVSSGALFIFTLLGVLKTKTGGKLITRDTA